MINVFSLGNPTPLANEGGIYHPHCRGRCRENSNPSAWEQFTFFALIAPEKCDSFGGKRSGRTQQRATTSTKKPTVVQLKAPLSANWNDPKIRKPRRPFSIAVVSMLLIHEHVFYRMNQPYTPGPVIKSRNFYWI